MRTCWRLQCQSGSGRVADQTFYGHNAALTNQRDAERQSVVVWTTLPPVGMMLPNKLQQALVQRVNGLEAT
jgi:hypothetical protein